MPDTYEDLNKLNDLKQKGVITEEEFNAEKQKILMGKRIDDKRRTDQSAASPQASANKWYENKIVVLVLCIIFFPVGLYALWKSNTISKGWKIAGTLIFVLPGVIAIILTDNKNGRSSVPQAHINSPTAKAAKAAYRSDSAGEKSISVQQIFEDTTNWSGTHLITGYVKQLNIQKDALGQGEKVTSISIGYDDKALFIILDSPMNPGEYKIGDQISIQCDFILINNGGNGRGTVFTGPVSVIAWDYAQREKAPSIITLDDYFGKNMRLGRTPITIVGQVAQKRVGTNELWIQLGSSTGTVQGEFTKSKINAKVKEQYESIQVGDRVAFKGSFNTELGGTAYFTIEVLILNPSY